MRWLVVLAQTLLPAQRTPIAISMYEHTASSPSWHWPIWSYPLDAPCSCQCCLVTLETNRVFWFPMIFIKRSDTSKPSLLLTYKYALRYINTKLPQTGAIIAPEPSRRLQQWYRLFANPNGVDMSMESPPMSMSRLTARRPAYRFTLLGCGHVLLR